MQINLFYFIMWQEFEEKVPQDDWNSIATKQSHLGLYAGVGVYLCIFHQQKQNCIYYLYLKAILSLTVLLFGVLAPSELLLVIKFLAASHTSN